MGRRPVGCITLQVFKIPCARESVDEQDETGTENIITGEMPPVVANVFPFDNLTDFKASRTGVIIEQVSWRVANDIFEVSLVEQIISTRKGKVKVEQARK